MRLQAFKPGQAFSPGETERGTQPAGLVVGGSDGTHFARLDQFAERAQRVGERCTRVVLVRLVQVNLLGLQPLE